MDVNNYIKKLQTGISGFDVISNGGIPGGRTTLVSGTTGSGKTILAVQFLAEGILKSNEPGIFVTFEESPADIKRNMIPFGWDIEKWEKEGKWLFVDGTIQLENETLVSGTYDLGALMSRIEYAINKIRAKRLSMDSIASIFSQFTDVTLIRHELAKINMALKKMNITAIMTSERSDEYGKIARYGVEEFVADNVIIMRNVLEDEKRRRTIELLKFRGTSHQKGEFPFTIIPEEGIYIIPLSAIELKQHSTDIRITSGNEELDKMCGGGFFRDSILLVSGATGTGKTLTCTEFISGGFKLEEKSLLFAFEESREQLFRNAIGWGIDFEKMEHEGKLMVICEYPEVRSMEDHLINMKKLIENFKPNRVAIDSLSALERIATKRGFREFVIAITSFIKHQEMAGLFTSTTPTLMGGSSVTEEHISTLTDTIILLRYVEMYGEMRRAVTVLKMRGSQHEKNICEFMIDGSGMHIGKAFRNITGILTGNPVNVTSSELERLDRLFKE